MAAASTRWPGSCRPSPASTRSSSRPGSVAIGAEPRWSSCRRRRARPGGGRRQRPGRCRPSSSSSDRRRRWRPAWPTPSWPRRSRSSDRPRPPPGSRRARRSATRSPPRPVSRWPAAGRSRPVSSMPPGRTPRSSTRAARPRRQGRRPRRRQGRRPVRRRGQADPHLVALLAEARSGAAEPAGTPRVVLEERLSGREVSVIAVTDGRVAPWRCRRRATTSGCATTTAARTRAAWAPTARCPTSRTPVPSGFSRRSIGPLLAELARRGTPFRGFLYAGLILTDAGPVLLECNARLGDPETQVILPRLAGPLGPVLLAAAQGDLGPGDPRPRRRSRAAHVARRRGRDRPGGGGLPEHPTTRGSASRVSTPPPRLGGLVFQAGTRGRPGRRLRDERRPGPDGRRSRRGSRRRPRGRRACRRRRSPGMASSAGATSRPTRPSRPAPPGSPDDPALHPGRDGRDLVRGRPVRGDARGRARGRSRPGCPGPDPGGRAGRHRGARPGRRRPDRRDRADDRPRRHRLRQPGRRDGSGPRAATCTSA